MLGFARNIVFFRINEASAAETSRLAWAAVAGVIACIYPIARAVKLTVPGDCFSSLMMLCCAIMLQVLRHFVQWNCCVEDLCSNLQLLKFEGTRARKLRFHIFNCWNLKEPSRESFDLTSSSVGIGMKPRTKAAFSHFQLLEFDGSIARKLCFHTFNFWKLKEASHESFVFSNHGCDLSSRICAKHCSFSDKRSFRCRDK